MTKLHRRAMIGVLLVWLLAVIYLMFCGGLSYSYGGDYGQYLLRHIELVPFESTQNYLDMLRLDRINPDIVARNIAGNIAMFVPLGFLLPCIADRFAKLKFTFSGAVLLAFVLEALQLLTLRGSFDIDDIILRSVGAMLGFAVWHIIFRFLRAPIPQTQSSQA